MNSENPNEDAPMKIEGAKNSRAKIIDCTIRDGGLMNSSRFSDKTVRAVYDCCADSGAEYMEIGFKNSKKIFSPAEYGAWRFCDEGDIARIIGGRPRNVKLSVMADAGKSDYKTDILDKSHSPIDLVRVACYSRQLDEALDMAKDAKDKGYEVSINLMAACKLSERQMMSDIERLAESDADILYLMDSFGSFYCKHVAALMKALEGICRPRGKKIGFHAHNNLQLAFAKTVQAEECGADFLDSTLGGLGRGAGNCNTELLLGYLGRDIAPAMRCVQREIEPMRQKLGWGFAQSYMIAGFLNQHPRAAMAYQEKTPDADILEFYEASKAAKDAEITARGRTPNPPLRDSAPPAAKKSPLLGGLSIRATSRAGSSAEPRGTPPGTPVSRGTLCRQGKPPHFYPRGTGTPRTAPRGTRELRAGIRARTSLNSTP